MKQTILTLKAILSGHWEGDGYARFPTIDDTAYTEQSAFIYDEYKNSILFHQKAWYKNDTLKNGETVFEDTGFILSVKGKIHLHSVQTGGRMEVYELTEANENAYTFNSLHILHDEKTIRSRRMICVSGDVLHYQLSMATHEAAFQNHLTATLKKIT